MIVNNLRRLLELEGITPYQLWRTIGGSKETIYNLYNHSHAIPRKDLLEKLLEEYGWLPGDVIKGTRDREDKDVA